MIKKGNKMQKNAFTMIELVFAIVVLGILTAIGLPNIDKDNRQEAADIILSNIRYTHTWHSWTTNTASIDHNGSKDTGKLCLDLVMYQQMKDFL